MSDAPAAAARCAECGADLPAGTAPCPKCACAASAGDRGRGEAAEAAPSESECPPSALWLRIGGAAIYLVVGVWCLYGAISFFRNGTTADVIFGAIALGLAAIALLGIKESLFPKDWTPE